MDVLDFVVGALLAQQYERLGAQPQPLILIDLEKCCWFVQKKNRVGSIM